MLPNDSRYDCSRSLPWLTVALVFSACHGAESDSTAPGDTVGLGGGEVERVSRTPAATNVSRGEAAAVAEAARGDSARERPDRAASADLGDPAERGTSAADGAAAEANGEEDAKGDPAGEVVVERPACSLAHPGGIANHQLVSGGREREYRLFVPASYDGETRLPLMLNLHGTGGDAAGQARDSGLESLAQEEGFIVVGLQGSQNRWNVLMSDPDEPNDVEYASQVLDDVSEKVCVDERRVYATGFSGGARMTSRLACNLAGRITAIAPVSGIRWTAPCSGRAVPVVTFHGLADPQNPYAGMAREDWVESVEDALEGWARHNGCSEARNETPEVDGVSIYSYGNCEGDAAVVLYRIAGLGHTWAKNEIDATREMWTFLESRTMP